MFCKYCGRQINEGETCTCRQPQGAGAPKMQPQSGSAPKIQQKIQQPKMKPPKQEEQPKVKPPKQEEQPKVKPPKPEKQPKVKPPKPEKQPKVKPPKPSKPPKVKEPKPQQEGPGGGKGLATASFACTAIMLISFVLLRFVLHDILGGSALEAVYPYLIYIVPLTFGMISLLLAIFSLQDKRIKSLSIIGILVSAVFMAGIFVSMKVIPYEADSYHSSDDDDEDDEDKEDEDSEDDKDKEDDDTEEGEESSSDSKIAAIQKEYEAGSLDYVQAKAAINGLDMEALEDEEALAVLTFQETIEKDLEEKMNTLAAASNYQEIMTTLSAMQAAGEDEFISGLVGKYEPEYILYLDTESKRLVEEGQKDAAVAMLEEAQSYVSDTNAVMNMLLEVQNAVGSGDYIIADSSSRYLTDADINGLTIQQVNYAKNEIYARHGRRFKSNELQTYFDSKSWYQGTISPESFNTNVLNDYEKKNAELLSKREFSMESGGYKLDVN